MAMRQASRLSAVALVLFSAGFLQVSAVSDDAMDDNSTTMGEEPALESASGPSFAFMGGVAYALGALAASYPSKMEGQPGWEKGNRKETILAGVSLCIMLGGGLSVTLAYQSGDSVPVLNAVVYATNLALNMFLQITFGITHYTKVMRMGTILFALVTVQLGTLAPPPSEGVDWTDILMPISLLWEAVFIFSSIVALFLLVTRVKDLPRTNAAKQMTWAFFIATLGSLTDNWAKINGAFDGFVYWALFIPYTIVGVLLMILSVAAMQQCDVGIYVPANLCFQLVLNVLYDFIVWGVASQLDNIVAYSLCFVICLLAIYISTPGADVGATLAQRGELNSAKMSQKVATSRFGKATVDLLESWETLKRNPNEAHYTDEDRYAKVSTFVSRGLEQKIWDEEEVSDLARVLLRRAHAHSGPNRGFVHWIQERSFFQDYIARDPEFGRWLESVCDETDELAPWEGQQAAYMSKFKEPSLTNMLLESPAGGPNP